MAKKQVESEARVRKDLANIDVREILDVQPRRNQDAEREREEREKIIGIAVRGLENLLAVNGLGLRVYPYGVSVKSTNGQPIPENVLHEVRETLASKLEGLFIVGDPVFQSTQRQLF